jgi:hypothetical protein
MNLYLSVDQRKKEEVKGTAQSLFSFSFKFWGKNGILVASPELKKKKGASRPKTVQFLFSFLGQSRINFYIFAGIGGPRK